MKALSGEGWQHVKQPETFSGIDNKMDYKLTIVLILTMGFALGSLLGYCAQRLKAPPILGYLLAGYLIGPYSPGFVANLQISEQLAEIGVILMLFGVGMHFRLKDLINVKSIAIPGAIGQTLFTTIAVTILIYYIGWPLESGVILGLSIGVASTVVLVRILSDNDLLHTQEGHIAIGWLIVEDIITVGMLILLPTIEVISKGTNINLMSVAIPILWMLAKFTVLVVILFTFGQKLVSYILSKTARLHSRELFTLTVLGLTFAIATSSYFLFGTSLALGAFLAGMVIGQTSVRHQASSHVLPIQDIFTVIFFLSIGMLFDPGVIFNHPGLFFIILAIIVIFKPLIALIIVWMMNYPLRTALIVSLALAQIGEFSFILAEEAANMDLLPDAGYDVIVACAIVSIAINPFISVYYRILIKLLIKTPMRVFDNV